MAEPTEAEQQKQTQALESLEKKSDQQQTNLGKLTSIIKEGNAFTVMAHGEAMGQEDNAQQLEKLSSEILRKNTKVQEKTLDAAEKAANEENDARKKKEGKDAEKAGKDDTANKNAKSWFERSGNYFDTILTDAKNKDFFEKHKVKLEGGFFTRQLKFLHILSKSAKDKSALDKRRLALALEGNRFQRLAHNMAVRAAKLALRAKPIVDWGVKGLGKMKDKAFDWIKSLGKLLLLVGIWAAAMWADANMLKEDWEALRDKLIGWKNKLVEWWGKLDGALDTVMEWWGKIKTWFQDIFGVELEAWHVALLAFGVWLVGPGLIAKGLILAATTAFKLAKGALKLMGFFKAKDALAHADEVAKSKKGFKNSMTKSSTATKRVNKLWGQWGKNIAGHADELDGLNKTIADNPNTKKGFFKTLGAKFTKMFSTVGDWAGSVGDKVGGWFKNAKTSVGGWFKSSMDTVKNLGKTVLDKGKNALSSIAEGAKNLVSKIPGSKAVGWLTKIGVGALKTVAKVAAPLEAVRGAYAGAASTGKDDKRSMNERMSDASAGMVKGLTDFLAVDLLDLAGMAEAAIRDKETGDTVFGGLAEKAKAWSDTTFGTWKEGTQLFDAAGNPMALRLEAPEWKKKMREANEQKKNLLAMTSSMGLLQETEVAGKGRQKSTMSKVQSFDKSGFQRLLLAASKDSSFSAMTQMISGLSKVGKISAEDAERYKMDISREQAAGTAPVIITNNNSTSNNAGGTSVLMGSSANDPMNQVLKDW